MGEMRDFKTATAPGCMSGFQTEALKAALEKSGSDLSIFSDLEGCGPVARLEEAFANLCGAKYSLALSSGTAALHTALLACEVGAGDEVIVTPYSWSQSVAPVLFTGATPVFADIHPETLNMSPDAVEAWISPRTKAIMPVHLFGHPAEMRRLQEIANKAEAFLICDGAHALGTLLDGQPAGRWGDITCFSLGRGKLVSAGEGGILATNDLQVFEKALALTQHVERLRRLKSLGNVMEPFGLNYRIHPLAAILGLSDLQLAGEKLRHRQTVLELYKKSLKETELLKMPELILGETPAAYGIPLLFVECQGREDFVATVQAEGVPLRAGPVRVPLHLRLGAGPGPLPPFHPSQERGACPFAEEQCERRELWALSAVDMDAVSLDEARAMGRTIAECASRIHRL
jgi:perosamine synthetase